MALRWLDKIPNSLRTYYIFFMNKFISYGFLIRPHPLHPAAIIVKLRASQTSPFLSTILYLLGSVI
jgi:hypothetical protein